MHDTTSPAPAGARPLGIALMTAAAFIALFWIIWLSNRTILAVAHTDTYYAWLTSFPLAVVWWLLSVAVAGVLLIRGNPTAIYWQFLAGGIGVYTGLLALLFDLENGVYVGRSGAGAAQRGIEITIVVFTLALSGYGLWWAWRNRGWAAKA